MVLIRREWYCREVGDERRKPIKQLPPNIPFSLPPPSNKKSSESVSASFSLILFFFSSPNVITRSDSTTSNFYLQIKLTEEQTGGQLKYLWYYISW